MHNAVYLLPGRGNRLRDLGDPVTRLGFDVYGRELAPPFSRLGFADLIGLIQHDLASAFWDADALLIGHSYGAYLLLHALADMEPFPGRILLLAPVLGAALDSKRLYLSRPPRADKLMQLAQNHEFPMPRSLEIHTGAVNGGFRVERPGGIQESAYETAKRVRQAPGWQVEDREVAPAVAKKASVDPGETVKIAGGGAGRPDSPILPSTLYHAQAGPAPAGSGRSAATVSGVQRRA